VSRRKLALAAVCVLLVIVAGFALLWTHSTESTNSSPSAPTRPSDQASTTAGVPACALTTLPPEVAQTVRIIHSNGPFPFPRNDGVVFGNREGHLPLQAKGYYREYTVITPGARNRSTRRIITGGTTVTDPRQYFYTVNHYDSFCLVTGAEGKP